MTPFTRSLCLLLSIACWVPACASPGPRVERVPADEVIDLSGYWNDTDSRLVSEEMIDDALMRPWIEHFRHHRRARPAVIVGGVANRSSEHIHTHTFTKDLERALVNSQRVRVVASSDERGMLRDERLDQLRHASIDTAKSMGRELGADYMLIGSIDEIVDAHGGIATRFYQVELELVDLESNEKAWIGQKKIKKVVRRDRYRY